MVSREDWTVPRWAREADGTDNTSNVTAPTSQKQDTGWTSSDVPVREWWNWLLRETGKGLEYFDEWLEGLLPGNCLARSYGQDFDYSVDGSNLEVLDGVVYVSGKRYVAPSTSVECPVQASQAVMHRIVYVHLSGGEAVIARADGASSGVDPVLTSTQIPIARVKQATGAALGSATIDDLREFGRIAMGRGTFDKLSGDCLVVDPVDTDDAAVERRYRRKIIPGRAFRVISGTAATYVATGFSITAEDTVAEYGIEEMPPGAILVRATCAYTSADGTAGLTFNVLVQNRLTGLTSSGYTSGTATEVELDGGSARTDIQNKSLGDFELGPDDMVIVQITGWTGSDMTVHSVTVEYIDERPILSFPKL